MSSLCAQEMALSITKQCQADFGIAVSGIFGPSGGSVAKPIGTVWASICYQNKILSLWNLQLLPADRSTMIQKTIHSVLAEFWLKKDNL